jgi:hypothetical protein
MTLISGIFHFLSFNSLLQNTGEEDALEGKCSWIIPVLLELSKTKEHVKSSIFWNIILCSPLKFNRHLGGACCLHLQAWRISQARNQCKRKLQANTWIALSRRWLSSIQIIWTGRMAPVEASHGNLSSAPWKTVRSFSHRTEELGSS